MKLKLFDVICLGGSLAIAIVYRALTGDTESADRIGLAFMMSWVALQSFHYARGHS
jgi:hypothetical protein